MVFRATKDPDFAVYLIMFTHGSSLSLQVYQKSVKSTTTVKIIEDPAIETVNIPDNDYESSLAIISISMRLIILSRPIGKLSWTGVGPLFQPTA